ncbi:MAG: GNAT family protein [Polyangiaceae bacterium]
MDPPYPAPSLSLATKLATPRLVLRPPRATDVPELRRALRASAEHLRAWNPAALPGEDPTSVTAVSRSIAIHRRAWRHGLDYNFLAMDGPDGETLVSRVTLSNVIRGVFHSAHLGYWTNVERIDSGFATEAVGRVVRFAFEEACLHRVQAAVMPTNVKSLRVLEKLGFRHEGRAEHYLFIGGAWQPHEIFARTREDLGANPET